MARRLSVTGEPIRLADDDRARNLLDLARRSVTRHRDRVAYTRKPSRRMARAEGREAAWQSVTFGDLWAWVERVAAGLAAWDVRPGDRVAIMSRSRPEWLVCDLAPMSLGAVTCPHRTATLIPIACANLARCPAVARVGPDTVQRPNRSRG